MDGQTPVNTVNTYTRIYRMYVNEPCGTDRVNAGDITATAATDGTVTACIKAGDGQTLMAIYTIPAGHTGYMTGSYFSVNKGGGSAALVDVVIRSSGPTDGTNPPWRVQHFEGGQTSGTSALGHPFNPPKVFTEKTDIVMRVNEVSADVDVSGGFDLVLEEN
jgi:hypothetical protein